MHVDRWVKIYFVIKKSFSNKLSESCLFPKVRLMISYGTLFGNQSLEFGENVYIVKKRKSFAPLKVV